MTEALFSITPAGELISARYYTITRETLDRKIITDELIDEILQRCSSAQGISAGGSGEIIPKGDSITECLAKPRHSDTTFTFDDLRVEILKKYDHKIDFFISRYIPAVYRGRQRQKSN
jgi:hypothetical protein